MAIKSFEGQPYFDDYLNEGASGNKSPRDKNYVRVLFQPGVAVQVRELNQIQSTLQNQIDQFGRSVYKDGTPVIDGLTSYDSNIYYVDIDIDDNGDDLVNDQTLISQLNTIGDGNNFSVSSLTAEILGYQKVYNQTGATGAIYRFFVRYLKADGTAGAPSTQIFSIGDTIHHLSQDESGTGIAIRDAGNTQTVVAFGDSIGSVVRLGYASSLTVEKGVFFINGNFVVGDKTTLFISKDQQDRELAGDASWLVTENTITANEDNDLLDQAGGQPNETAPGAHRYQISLELKFITSDTNVLGNVVAGNTTTENNPNVIASDTQGQFVNLLNVSTDKAIIPARTEYTSLDRKFAERTFDESGNYTVKPFQLDLREFLNNEEGNRGRYTKAEILNTGSDPLIAGVASLSDAEEEGEKKFLVGLEPSTAYVSGYRIDLNEKVEIPVDKARDTFTLSNLEVSATIGGFVFGDFTSGNTSLFDPTDTSSTAEIKQSNTVIGRCQLRTIEKVSVSKYQLYIYDVQMDPGKFLANATTILRGGFEFEPLSGESFEIQNSSETNSIIPLPIDTVASVSITSMRARKLFPSLNGTTPSLTLAGTGETFYSDAVSDYVVVKDDGTDVDLDVAPTNATGSSMSITVPDLGTGGDAIAPYKDADVSSEFHQKVIETKTDEAFSDQNVSSDGYIILNTGTDGTGGTSYEDLINVTKVQVQVGSGSFVEIPKSDYVLDNGQRDNFYDVARIEYTGSNDYTTGTINWKISFRYWKWNSTGNYGIVNSYNGGSSATYKDIPIYKNNRLSDVIDFRQKKSSTSVYPVDPNGLIEITTLEHYEARIDKVVVNNIGEFSVVKGTPSSNPIPPVISEDRMALYELSVPGFTEEASNIIPKYLDNRRYTMKDIGSLARRIKNVEYYTSLSLLESETLDKDIFDGAGAQRFKNGILVDSFFGHNVGNPSDTDYSCSIDASKGILRPQFEMNDTLLKTITTSELNSDIIELDYTEDILIDQPLASISESVNPFDLADWQGHVKLTPTTDEWKEVNQRPDIVINDTSSYDQFAQMAEEQNMLGTIWDEWEVAWRGTTTETRNINIGRHDGSHDPTGQNRAAKAELGFDNWRPIRGELSETFTTTTEVRSGIRRTLDYFDHTVNLGEKIVDVSFVPFIRSRRINFEAKLMKPNTKLYAYFDGKDVSAYCTAGAQTSGAYDDVTHSDAIAQTVATFKDRSLANLQASELSSRVELITDDNGVLRGSLIIPNNDELRFRTGERIFKLTDSAKNQDAEQTTSAQATYNASGLIESKSNQIVTTRIPQFNEQRLSDVRNSTVLTDRDTSKVQYYDPLAQSFIIGDYQNGVYSTGIELWFQKKHDTIPVRTHLVTVENGIPTQRVVPGTEVILNPGEVQASIDGAGTNATAAATPTLFTYDQPVYLQPGVEYAIVVLSNSPEYRLWMAETGGIDNNTTPPQKISKNPYAGVSFKSQNASTWTPNQNRDFKFKIKRAVYSTSKIVDFQTEFSGRVISANLDDGGNNYSQQPTITVEAPGNGGRTAVITVNGMTGSGSTQTISGITLEDSGSGYTKVPTVSISGGGNASISLDLNTFSNSYLRLLAEEVKLPGTDITYEFVAGGGISSGGNTILANQNIDLLSSIQLIGARDANNAVNNKTITVRATLTTSDTNITPQLDSQRLSLLSVHNLINDPASQKITDTNDGDFVTADDNDTRTNLSDSFKYLTDAGLESAKMSYITRSVILNSPADRINIFLAANRPNINTNIRVLIKLRVGEENYDSVPWYEIKPTDAIPITPEGVFREVEFDFNPEDLDSADSRKSIEFNAFAVRVILTSNDHRIIPTVKDFRAIATFS